MRIIITVIFFLITNFTIAQVAVNGMPVPDNGVWAILRIGNTVYIGGDFLNINGTPRAHLASFDATTGALTNWDTM